MATEETVYERWTKWLMNALAQKKFVEDESAIHMALTGIVSECGQLPHGEKDCVLWYDGCHCTLETLEHLLTLAMDAAKDKTRLETIIVSLQAERDRQAIWATTAWSCQTCAVQDCVILADLRRSGRDANDLVNFGCRYWEPIPTQEKV